ncbi:uncharacterized protein LOC135387964 [Ornithodoros turicata]|uniref:uncharacterized protein LOC135387964 n=1 Tax=Ornithodoros turicata TaxID=34597 RepID=UPI0031395D1B
MNDPIFSAVPRVVDPRAWHPGPVGPRCGCSKWMRCCGGTLLAPEAPAGPGPPDGALETPSYIKFPTVDETYLWQNIGPSDSLKLSRALKRTCFCTLVNERDETFCSPPHRK